MIRSSHTTFAAFRHYNYRLWFGGQLMSLIGSWVQNAAQGYMVYTLTGSSAYLGYVSLAFAVPTWVLLLVGGVIADRVSRRKLMLVTQSAMMVLAFSMAALVFSGLVRPWHILVISFLLGTANAFDAPARQALLVELVGREDLTNAIAHNATIVNSAMIVGPSVAGVLYAAAGPAWCFTINGFSYLAVILALSLMRIAPWAAEASQTAGKPRASAVSAILEGIRYVREHRLVRMLTLSAFFYNIFDYAMIIFIPAFAVQLFKGNATVNGALLTANAAGAVAGGFLLAARTNRMGRGRLWAITAYMTPLMILSFTLVGTFLPTTLWLALLITALVGVASITVLNNTNAMIQSTVTDELRGRVMSLYSLTLMAGGPTGGVILGWLGDQTNISVVLLVLGGMAAVFAVWVRVKAGEVRAMD